jgi:hypothetical protein
MSGARKILFLVAVAAVGMVSAACSNSGNNAPPSPSFSPLPSLSIPSSLPASVQQSLCQHVAQLRQTVSQVQASPAQAAAQVHTSLNNASSQLKSDVQQLQTNGQAQLAQAVQRVATAVDALNASIPQSGNLPSGIQSAMVVVTGALQQIPLGACPSPTA